MAKNRYGYVIVRWEDEPPENPKGYHKISFTVMDAGEGKKEVFAGSLKMYGKNMPKNLLQKIGQAIVDAQYYQR